MSTAQATGCAVMFLILFAFGLGSLSGHEECVTLLWMLRRASTNHGFTSLIWASQSGHERIVHMLLDAKASVDQADNHGGKSL